MQHFSKQKNKTGKKRGKHMKDFIWSVTKNIILYNFFGRRLVFCFFCNRIPDRDKTMTSFLRPRAFRLGRHEFTAHQGAAWTLHKENRISQYASHRLLYLGISRHYISNVPERGSKSETKIPISTVDWMSTFLSEDKWSSSIWGMNNVDAPLFVVREHRDHRACADMVYAAI